MTFLGARCHELNPDGSLQIMYGSTVGTPSPRRSSTTWRATGARGRSGSATTRSASSSSTSTASSWTRSTCTTSTALRSPTTCGSRFVAWSTGSATTGTARTGASGSRGEARRHWVYSKLMCWVADRPGPAPGRQALVPGRPGPLAAGAGRDLRGDHGPRLERQAPGLHAVVRQRHPGRQQPHDAARLLRRPDDPKMLAHDRRHQPLARGGGPGGQQPRVPLQPTSPAPTGSRATRGRSTSARSGWSRPSPGRKTSTRPVSTRRGSCSRACSAMPTTSACSPSRPRCRGGARQLPAGLHPSGPDQRRRQSIEPSASHRERLGERADAHDARASSNELVVFPIPNT